MPNIYYMRHEVKLPWTRGGGAAMPKNEWGPIAWSWLHGRAISYSDHPKPAERLAMFSQFWSFILTLPCDDCREHAVDYTRKYPPDFSNSVSFQTWAWRFHNAVNRRLRKPVMSEAEYLKVYAGALARKGRSDRR